MNKIYQCNNCYHEEERNCKEGCFTSNVQEFVLDKTSPCLDGTWGNEEVKPVFKELL